MRQNVCFHLLAVFWISLLFLACNDSEVSVLETPPEDGDTDQAVFNPDDTNLDDDDDPDGDEDGDILDGDEDQGLPDDDDDDNDLDGDEDGDLPDGDEDQGLTDDDDDLDGDEDGDLPDGDEDQALSDDDDDDDELYVSDSPIYQPGVLGVDTIGLEKDEDEAPVPMLIHVPSEPGSYAVVIFQHGYLMSNAYYSDLLTHLASHGFIVIVPQMYTADLNLLDDPNSAEEAELAQTLTTWVHPHLANHVSVTPRTDRLGLAGHSRGGKVIWSVLKQSSRQAIAVAGVDPVDSSSALTGEVAVVDGPFNFPFPSLVIGTGYGPQGITPCAPSGKNHEQFYEASAPLAFHVVATEYGHTDMLDDDTEGCGLPCTTCKSGESREPMRKLTAGLLVAFFRATLQGATDNYVHLANADDAPIAVTMEAKSR